MNLESLDRALQGDIAEKLEVLKTGQASGELRAAAAMLIAQRGRLRAARHLLAPPPRLDDLGRQAVEAWLDSFGSFRRRRRAEAIMRGLIEEHPDSALLRLCHSRVLLALNRPGEAAKESERALEIAPGSCLAQSLVALSRARLRVLSEAAAAAAAAASTSPESALACHAEMIVALRQRRLDVAADAYRVRARILDLRAFPIMFRLWAAGGWAAFFIFGATAVVGMWLRNAVLVGVGSVGLLLEVPFEYDVFRSWRRAVLSTAIALLPWVPLLLW